MSALAKAPPIEKEPPRLSHLDAIEQILEAYLRPMSAPEIAAAITQSRIASIGGETPWKTIGARLASDIRDHAERSRFKRTYHGRFALRHWDYEPEFQVQKRVLNPLDETIKAVPIRTFLEIARGMAAGKSDPSDFRLLITAAIDLPRREAENTEEYVQLIPTFVICQNDDILTYRRTKRLPEARLHHARCINFGGHMQADDTPLLFWDDDAVVSHFLHRELFEELEFEPSTASINPLGLLYLQSSSFERQHAGLTFQVVLEPSCRVRSLEPGMHSDMGFCPIDTLLSDRNEIDSWSRVLLDIVANRA